MKKFSAIRAAVGFAMGLGVVAAHGASTQSVASIYLEGNLGFTHIKDVSTIRESRVLGGITLTNFQGTLDYDESAYGGVEIGFRNFSNPSLRLGISANTLKAKFQSAEISGSITNGSTTYTGPISVSRANVAGLGLDLDNRVNFYSFNAYYDFSGSTEWTPFVGLGLGLADIKNAKDNEFTYSLHAGINYDINPWAYIGARIGWYHIEGPTDKLGFNFENLKATTAGVIVGYRF